jgi:hypothetical protein
VRSLHVAIAVAVAVVAAGCTSSGPMAPTTAAGLSGSASASGKSSNPVARETDVLEGIAAGCVTGPTPLSWLIKGQNDLIVATAHSDSATCEATKENPRNPGLAKIAPEGTNQRISYPTAAYGQWVDHPCGRIQVDIEDRASSVLLVGMVINYGVNCTPPPPTTPPPTTPPPPTPPPPPPPPTSCGAAQPSFTAVFPAGAVSGSATVQNAGSWTLTLYAAMGIEGYQTDAPDWVKGSHATTLACLESSTLSVSYPWSDHPATHWWMVLTRDGAVVYKSVVALRP